MPAASRHSPAAQALGCRIYTIFCAVYAVLMLASIAQLLPVTSLERAFFTSRGDSILRTGIEATRAWRPNGVVGQPPVRVDNADWWVTGIILTDFSSMWLPFGLAVLYVCGVFGGQAWMKARPESLGRPKLVKRLLAAWSVALALFSVAGSLRTVPMLLRLVFGHGLPESVCGSPGLWCSDRAGAGYARHDSGLFLIERAALPWAGFSFPRIALQIHDRARARGCTCSSCPKYPSSWTRPSSSCASAA